MALEDGASVDDKGLDRADPISLTNSALAQPGKISTPAKCQHQNLSGQFYLGSQKSRIFRANAHSKPLEGVEVLSGSKAKHPVLAQGGPRPLRDIGLISGDCIHASQCHQRTVRSLHRASADVLRAPYSAEVRALSIGRAKGARD